MSETSTLNTLEQKNDQTQNADKPVIEAVVHEEVSPQIKSEENKANWKAFREQREADRKAREESDRKAAQKAAEAEALKAALEALTGKSNDRQMNHNYSDDIEETEEARIDRRVNEAIRKKEEQYERERLEREQREYPQKLQSTFGDFNKVCSSENLDYLEYHYPELSIPFKHMPDGFDKWASIYKAVKRFVPNIDSKNDQIKAEKNLQKPGSISSTGNTHGGNAMPSARLDDSRKAENWARMQRSMKGLT